MENTTIKLIMESEDHPGTSTAPSDPNIPLAENPMQSGNKASQGSKTTAAIVGIQLYKTAVSYASSRVGMWTGSSEMQRQVDMAGRLIGHATAFAVNPILGAVSLGLDVGTSALDNWHGRRMEAITMQVLNERAGVQINRSRTPSGIGSGRA
ncbi:MAG: hypothetical protein FWC68_06435 [Oscillospiraceae bacterium]|nr:hypothetical protein [Oscillospiraceae bacterium]